MWKFFRASFRKILPIFVFSSPSYGGLTQSIFLCLFCQDVAWKTFHAKVLLYCSPLWVIVSKWLVGDSIWYFTFSGSSQGFLCIYDMIFILSWATMKPRIHHFESRIHSLSWWTRTSLSANFLQFLYLHPHGYYSLRSCHQS